MSSEGALLQFYSFPQFLSPSLATLDCLGATVGLSAMGGITGSENLGAVECATHLQLVSHVVSHDPGVQQPINGALAAALSTPPSLPQGMVSDASESCPESQLGALYRIPQDSSGQVCRAVRSTEADDIQSSDGIRACCYSRLRYKVQYLTPRARPVTLTWAKWVLVRRG